MRSSQTSVLHLAAGLIVIFLWFECHIFLRHKHTYLCTTSRAELFVCVFFGFGWHRIVKMFLQSFLNLCQFFGLEQKLFADCLILIEVVQIQS